MVTVFIFTGGRTITFAACKSFLLCCVAVVACCDRCRANYQEKDVHWNMFLFPPKPLSN